MKKLAFELLLFAFVQFCHAQDNVMPYFNIALKKKVEVNATCGEGLDDYSNTFCKLVGHDSFLVTAHSTTELGQVIFKRNFACESC